MRSRITRLVVILTTSLVSVVGLITLLGLLLGDVTYSIPDAIPGIGGTGGVMPTGVLSFYFVRLAVVVLAMSIIIGLVNLIVVNASRIIRGRTVSARLSSLVVLISFTVGIAAAGLGAQTRELNDFLLEDVQTTIESALAGLLFFTLVYGAFRMLRREVTWSGILFIITVEIVLIGALPVAFALPVEVLTDWLFSVPVNAGARGILLGIGLATLITGLRVLIGQDRTYGE